MIVTELYKGQGFGNQLWCYVSTRVLALSKGYAYGIQSPEKFKGSAFMDVDFGELVVGGEGPEGGPPSSLPDGIEHYLCERALYHPDGSDVRMRDERLAALKDNTKLDGYFQDVSLIQEHKDDIREWLAIDPAQECFDYASDDICVINFRGGGYVRDSAFFLPPTYWTSAIANMRAINPAFRFVVITDDVRTGKRFFPDFDVFHFSIAKDYIVIKNAHYLILSNSSFAWFPAWLSTRLKYCIAPKYWGRHNTSDGYWSLGYSLTPGWMYQDRDGSLTDYATCAKDFETYLSEHASDFIQPSDEQGASDPRYAAILKKQNYRSPLGKLKMRLRSLQKRLALKIILLPGVEPALDFVRDRRTKRSWHSPSEIREHRKSVRVYDIFTFFNELKILELRLNVLDPVVDFFVIIEATETFTGKPKPLYYAENKERFKKWEHKIIHYVIDDTPKDQADLRRRLHGKLKMSALERRIAFDSLTSDNIGKGKVHWFKEFYQKECILKALTGLKDDDVCYVSDVDEIWNPDLVIDYSKRDVFKLRQVAYVYFLNNRSSENWRGWTGTIVTQYRNIKDSCLNHLRTAKKNRYTVLRNGGWHFTFQGGADQIRKKLASYGHQELNTPEITSRAEELILYNKDIWGRNIRFRKDESSLPTYLLENRSRYAHLLLP